jgi:hypothetical protein
MRTFQRRIAAVLRDGGLTVMDLSRWFDRAYPTVRTWQQGREPWGPHGEESRLLLTVLEKAIAQERGFPVPVKLSPRARKAHIERVRDELVSRLPRTRFAR